MGWTIGIPSLKLSTTTAKSKHCGNFKLVASEALEERLGRDPDINPELSHLNVYYGFKSAKELIAYSDTHCATLRDAKGRALRSDAVRMCVTLFKPPAAYMATLTQEEQLWLLHDGIDKIKELVGENNVKAIAVHFDEQGPHAHIFWEPMTKDGRLCAKEMHNLQFFKKINTELPRHLRHCGWDIDDCNVYDQAQAKLMSEKEKAEQRRKNGRSSSVFKAEAEMKRNHIDLQIDYSINVLEKQVGERINQSIDEILKNNDGVYDNALFLISECDDARFEELDREGLELKKSILQKEVNPKMFAERLKPLAEQIRDASRQELPYKKRMAYWERYREMSEEFWEMRESLKWELDEKHEAAQMNYMDAWMSYSAALTLLHETDSLLVSIFAAIWAITAIFEEDKMLNELAAIQHERRELTRYTSSFKKYSSRYRDQLKNGECPFAHYLETMETIVGYLDNEYHRIKEIPQEKSRVEDPANIPTCATKESFCLR